jgi:hypothetical protein
MSSEIIRNEHLSSIWVAFNGYIMSIEVNLYIDTRTQIWNNKY